MNTTMSQADLERNLRQQLELVENGEKDLQAVIGDMQGWIIQIANRNACLHPYLKQWMWYDKLHDEWVLAECGMEEAILLTLGKVGGIKKLPQPGIVDDWCLYMSGKTLEGPLTSEQLFEHIQQHSQEKDAQVWSTRANNWLNLMEVTGKTITLANASDEIVLQLNKGGHFDEMI